MLCSFPLLLALPLLSPLSSLSSQSCLGRIASSAFSHVRSLQNQEAEKPRMPPPVQGKMQQFSKEECMKASKIFKAARGHEKLRFEHLRPLHHLGSGAFGKVTSYKWGNSPDQVAVKAGDQKSLLNEAKVYEVIEERPHKSLLKFHGLHPSPEEKEGKKVLVLEKAEGEPLYAISPEHFRSKELWKQFLSVLKHMSSLGISHGDLHGGNVLYDLHAQHLTLLDMGMAEGGPSNELLYDLQRFFSILLDNLQVGGAPYLVDLNPSESSEAAYLERLSSVPMSGKLKKMFLTLLQHMDDLLLAYAMAEKSEWILDPTPEDVLRSVFRSSFRYRESSKGLSHPPPYRFHGSLKNVYPVAVPDQVKTGEVSLDSLALQDVYYACRSDAKGLKFRDVRLVGVGGVKEGRGDSGKAIAEILLRLGGLQGFFPRDLEDALPKTLLSGKAFSIISCLINPALSPERRIEEAKRKAQEILGGTGVWVE